MEKKLNNVIYHADYEAAGADYHERHNRHAYDKNDDFRYHIPDSYGRNFVWILRIIVYSVGFSFFPASVLFIMRAYLFAFLGSKNEYWPRGGAIFASEAALSSAVT